MNRIRGVITWSALLAQASLQKALETGFALKQPLELPPGTREIRIGVRDVRSGALGTAFASVPAS